MTQFFQLRQGDKFMLQGLEYMKLNEYKTTEGSLFNARETLTGNDRYIISWVKVIPDDEYFLTRITPVDAPGNVV